MYKIENILYNNIKTNLTHINGNKIKIKSNRANSKNIVINEIRNFYSNSQIDYFKNKNKSSITTLYDLNKNIYKNCDLNENCNLKIVILIQMQRIGNQIKYMLLKKKKN